MSVPTEAVKACSASFTLSILTSQVETSESDFFGKGASNLSALHLSLCSRRCTLMLPPGRAKMEACKFCAGAPGCRVCTGVNFDWRRFSCFLGLRLSQLETMLAALPLKTAALPLRVNQMSNPLGPWLAAMSFQVVLEATRPTASDVLPTPLKTSNSVHA